MGITRLGNTSDNLAGYGGSGAHTEGLNAIAVGTGAHAEGQATLAPGNYAHAEGAQTQAAGIAAHAENGFTSASGNYAHAEGDTCTASGLGSHAEGKGCVASGNYSHAQGYNCFSTRAGQNGQAATTTYTVGTTYPQNSTYLLSGATASASNSYVELTSNGAAVTSSGANVVNVLTVPLRATWSVAWEGVARGHQNGNLQFSNGALFRGDCLVMRGPNTTSTVLAQSRIAAGGGTSTTGLTAPLYSSDGLLDGSGLEVSIVQVDSNTHYVRFRGYNGNSTASFAFVVRVSVVEMTTFA